MMGTGERGRVPTVVLRLCGQTKIGPSEVCDQSWPRVRWPISLLCRSDILCHSLYEGSCFPNASADVPQIHAERFASP